MRFDRILLAFIAVLFVVYVVILSLSWDYLYPWVDIPLHIAGGFWVGLLFFYLFFERQRILSADMGFIPLACLTLGFVAFIGVGWEVYEYLSSVFVAGDIPFGGSVPGVHFDTLKDLFDDLFGGGLAVLWYVFARRGGRQA